MEKSKDTALAAPGEQEGAMAEEEENGGRGRGAWRRGQAAAYLY